MFDNILFQNSTALLTQDLKNNKLPSSILLSGPQASGKLSCALELARILSCTGEQKGHWLCNCNSCKKNKELTGTNIVLAGPRDCSLEILAAKKNLLFAGRTNASYLNAARYLFIRSVRKLTLRFSPVLWEGDAKVSKLAPVLEEINEQLELLNPDLQVPENDELEKICDTIVKQAEKLESTFMYDSLPIDHIRRAAFWTHLKSSEGKKVLIIENAERMNESCRNALLKILEEPPEDAIFILTTTSRGAVMPTILSRVRTYNFYERNEQEQASVIERVFHDNPEKGNSNIQTYLNTFLPVSPMEIEKAAFEFYQEITENHLIQISDIIKKCGDFEPRKLFKIFLESLCEAQREVQVVFDNGCHNEMEAENLKVIHDCWNNVTIYNQKPLGALENLYRELASIRRKYLK